MPTRRSFIAQAAVSGALVAAPSVATSQSDSDRFDIAVVGGGAAGTFCAMRLRQETNASVAAFELTDRIGGRLLSVHFPGVPSQTAEIGGMRLRHTDDIALKMVHDLIGQDQLQDFGYPNTGYFVRDALLADLSDIDTLPYRLDEAERKIITDGGNLLGATVEALTEAAKTNQERFNTEGLWELLLKTRSKEGVDFVRDTLGYDSLLSNRDALSGIPWFAADFAPDTHYLKLKGGLERIPMAASAAFRTAGGDFYSEHRLVRIDRQDSGDLNLIFETNAGQRRVTAGRAILALPPHAMLKLAPESLIFGNPRFVQAMRDVHQTPMAKIHMSFAQNWWTLRNMGDGLVVTDLPVRQIYRWGVEPETGAGLLMASYHDGPLIDFWDSLSGGPAFGPPDWISHATGPNGGPLARSMQESLPASERLVTEAWRQVRAAHGLGDDVPAPIAATYHNWGDDPWGAAIHLWNVDTNPQDTMAYLQEPFPGVHVCNEAWSIAQGWTHGAVTSAEAMLTAKFGLSPYVTA